MSICQTCARKIEEAANRFGQERTLENAEAFVRAVYGCGVKKEEENDGT